MKGFRWIAAALAACACACAQFAHAAGQAVEAQETAVLQRAAVSGTDRELGMGIAEFPPNAAKPRHKATGPELCYVLAGEVIVQIEGKPAHRYRAGESFALPANAVHVTTAGASGAKVLASWVHTPGKPFNVPAGD
ncbi:cupin domain-containing protein [Paraburkholderia sp. C35]|uniref:cupin domain-containing protein n=1 Tax=Paraburkholderia sp. C35 TaxID=2126993 RepID=UPI000D698A5D|nr:cupin domain-containing protein [Paraburkholderia sp. C35]